MSLLSTLSEIPAENKLIMDKIIGFVYNHHSPPYKFLWGGDYRQDQIL